MMKLQSTKLLSIFAATACVGFNQSMKRYIKLGLIPGLLNFAFLLTYTSNAGAIQVNQVQANDKANDLAKGILEPIEGANVVKGKSNFLGNSSQGGFFYNNTTTSIDEGIILSTGKVKDAEGPNSKDRTTTEFYNEDNDEHDSLNDLENISGAGSGNTGDAAILQTRFKWNGGDFSLKYSFASEEYNEGVENASSGPNDPFAIFVSKTPVQNRTNIAKTPDGDNVTIDNINAGETGNKSNSDNSDTFNNNDRDNTNTPYDIEYDGFTDPLTGKKNLKEGTYVLRMGVTDAGSDSDNKYSDDTAVLVQGEPTSQAVPEPNTILGLTLAGGLASLLKKKTSRK